MKKSNKATNRKIPYQPLLPPGLYVIFDGPPSHESGRFVELEDERGNSQGAVPSGATWRRAGKRHWSLGPFARVGDKP